MKGSCRPIIWPSVTSDRCVTWPSTVHGNPERPEGHRGGVEDQRVGQRLQRREAHQDEHGARDGDRRAEPGDAFEQGAEAEADDDQDDSAVVGQVVSSQSRRLSNRPEATATL